MNPCVSVSLKEECQVYEYYVLYTSTQSARGLRRAQCQMRQEREHAVSVDFDLAQNANDHEDEVETEQHTRDGLNCMGTV